jgi:hypothetical protein
MKKGWKKSAKKKRGKEKNHMRGTGTSMGALTNAPQGHS